MFLNITIFTVICYILLSKKVSSLKSTDFCIINKEMELEVICKHEQCGFDLCAIDHKSCSNLNRWYATIEKYIDSFYLDKDIKNVDSLNTFLGQIKHCEPSKYIELRKHVCSIREHCQFNQQYELSQVLKPFRLKLKPCFCKSNLKFRCHHNYCSDSKQTCKKFVELISDDLTQLKLQFNKC